MGAICPVKAVSSACWISVWLDRRAARAIWPRQCTRRKPGSFGGRRLCARCSSRLFWRGGRRLDGSGRGRDRAGRSSTSRHDKRRFARRAFGSFAGVLVAGHELRTALSALDTDCHRYALDCRAGYRQYDNRSPSAAKVATLKWLLSLPSRSGLRFTQAGHAAIVQHSEWAGRPLARLIRSGRGEESPGSIGRSGG